MRIAALMPEASGVSELGLTPFPFPPPPPLFPSIAIRRNCIESMQTIIESMQTLEIKFSDPELESVSAKYMNLDTDATLTEDMR